MKENMITYYICCFIHLQTFIEEIVKLGFVNCF